MNRKIIISLLLLFLVLAFVVGAFIMARNKDSLLNKNNGTSSFSSQPTGVIHSNQWYSSIYNKFPTDPMYAFPIAYRLLPEGLSFSYPNVKKDSNTIFGTYANDFIIGTNSSLNKPEITNIGDFSVSVSMKNDNNSISFTLAHGIPHTTISSQNGNLQTTFQDSFEEIKNEKIEENAILVNTKDRLYLFVSEEPIKKTGKSLLFGGSKKVFVGLLDQVENLETVIASSTSDIQTTSTTYQITGDKLITTLSVKSNTPPLIGLLPHQRDNGTNNKHSGVVYNSIRGDISVIQTSSFSMETPLIIPDTNFPQLKNRSHELNLQLIKDIDDFIKNGAPASKNYFLGAWLGKGVTLIQLAEALDEKEKMNQLVSFIIPIFEKSLDEFIYDEKQKSMIAKTPEFGNERLNDHHFHYGYFIRVASILSNKNPELLNKIKDKVDLMVLDIANYDRSSQQFPYSRNFDTYESHSWADGYAGFYDGNNQESSSEAINAWYGVYLWANTTQNDELKNHALYLYNSEILGTYYYWFNESNAYTVPYEHEIASIVWGGKIDYATWFSDSANMKYGIQILPLTPGSDYLGKLDAFPKYKNDFFKSGGKIENEWGDLFVAWQSFYEPQEAIKNLKLANKSEGNTAKSAVMYFVNKNAEK